MATVRIDAQSSGLEEARQNLLKLRQRMTDINVQLERNATEYRRASEVQRVNLRLGKEELTLARRRASNSAAQIRNYIAEQNELKRLTREKERANRASRTFQSSLRGIAQDLRFFAVGFAIQGLSDFARNMVSIGAETETARATLRQFTNDVEGTFQRLERESRTLVGIDLTSITQTFTQFRAGGAEAEEAISLIRGFSKSLAELGVAGYETVRFMGQLRQSFAANRIEGDDVKTLIEVMPTFLNRASQSLGVQVQSWKDLQAAIDASGKTVRQFYIDLARQQDLQSAGADLNTFRAQTELLREEFQGLQRDLSERLLPVLTRIIRGFRTIHFGGGDISQGLRVELPDISEIEKTQISLSKIESERAQLNKEIAEFQKRTGVSLEGFREASLKSTQELKRAQEELSSSAFSERGIRANITTQLNQQVELRKEALELQKSQNELEERAARLRESLVPQRPTASFPGGAQFPRSLVSPQVRPEIPDSVRRSLADIGPQVLRTITQALGETLNEDSQRLRRVLVPPTDTSDAFGGIRPTIPSQFQIRGVNPPPGQVSPQEFINIPDLSGGISDLRQAFEILRIESRDLFNRLQANARVASIPVFNFARGLRNLGGVLRQAKQESDELTASIDAGRRRFAQQAEAELQRSQRFGRNVGEVGIGAAFDLSELPIQQARLGIRASDQRSGINRRLSESIEDIQRNTARRIEEIENTRELSARVRAERITEIQRAAAHRREDIEIQASRNIAQIDRQLSAARKNIAIDFADGVIAQINRVVQAELASRFLTKLLDIPSFGTAGLILTGIGLTAAQFGLQQARPSVDDQIQRVNAASRQNIVIENNLNFSDGTSRSLDSTTKRVDDEGRIPR